MVSKLSVLEVTCVSLAISNALLVYIVFSQNAPSSAILCSENKTFNLGRIVKDIQNTFVSGPEKMFPSRRVIEKFQSQASERQRTMKIIINHHRGDFLNFYTALVPEVHCDEMVRLGRITDGGKWLCSPYELPSECVVMSVGLNGETSFESDIQNMTESRCRLFAYDMGEQPGFVKSILEPLRGKTRKATISKKTKESKSEYTLSDLMKLDNYPTVEILKMDAEGAEKTCLEPFLKNNTVAQIVVEMHGVAHEMGSLLNKLAKLGYWLAFYEENGRYKSACEVTLIHESAFERYKVTKLARYFNF